MHLIVVVEADKNSKSDYIYIWKYINACYLLDSSIKISPVYMGGKGNYKSNNVNKKIEDLTRKYKGQHGADAKQIVMLCTDTDDLTDGPNAHENITFMKDVEALCNKKGYNLIWFCRDIEEVFIGRRITKKEKAKTALNFSSINVLHTTSRLRKDSYIAGIKGTSNLDSALRNTLNAVYPLQ